MHLILDTSTERGIVAFGRQGKIVKVFELPQGLQNSKHAILAIEQGFKSLSIDSKDLKAIVVGSGPGSYTGIRVGVAMAKAFAYSLQIPLIGISTLQAFIPQEDGSFAAVIDAKMGGVYALFGVKEGSLITYLSDPKLISINDLTQLIADKKWVVTPQSDSLLQKVVHSNWIESAPNAEQMLKLAEEKRAHGEYSLDGSLQISYLQEWG